MSIERQNIIWSVADAQERVAETKREYEEAERVLNLARSAKSQADYWDNAPARIQTRHEEIALLTRALAASQRAYFEAMRVLSEAIRAENRQRGRADREAGKARRGRAKA